jgi:AcrR family transcriptional regulator
MGMATDTRQRILEVSLRLFNAHGLHAVGVRDIARALEISPGNLAYHFPQKDVLVAELVQGLHAANNEAARLQAGSPVSLLTLYSSLVKVMKNHLQYRFYLLSYVDVMRASEELRAVEHSLSDARRRRTETFMRRLIEEGYLEARLTPRMERLHEQWTILMMSWLRSVETEWPRRSDREALEHYAKLVIALFEPFCTPQGEAQMEGILSGRFDEEVFGSDRPPESVANQALIQAEGAFSTRE